MMRLHTQRRQQVDNLHLTRKVARIDSKRCAYSQDTAESNAALPNT
jgi:hypothetical protein